MGIKLLTSFVFVLTGLTGSLALNLFLFSNPNFPKSLPELFPEITVGLPKFERPKGSRSLFRPLLGQAPPPQPSEQKKNTEEEAKKKVPEANPSSPLASLLKLFEPKKEDASTTKTPEPLPSGALEISENDLNLLLRNAVPPTFPLKNIFLELPEGKIILKADLATPLVSEKFLAEGGLALKEGLPTVQFSKVQIGGLSLPTGILSSLEATINKVISDQLKEKSLVKIKVLEIKDRKIRLLASF